MSEDKPSPPPPPPPPPAQPSQSPTGQEQPTSPSSSSQPPPPPPLPKHTQDLNYMHRPPRIVPNYGKKPRGVLPKSNLSRVLLYDNVTQQQMLHVKMNHLKTEQRKTGHLLDLHRKSFMVRRQQKQKHIAETTLHVSHTLPVLTITTNTTTTAEKPPGAKPRVRKAWGEATQRNEDVNEPPRHLLTPRSTTGEGGGSEKEGTLPSLTRQRQGASTSQGFALHPLPSVQTAQRGLHTATMTQREGQDTLPDLTPRSSARSEKVHLLHMDNSAGGLTRVMHTFQRRSSRGGGGERGEKGRKGKGGKAGGGDREGRTTEDERYRKLEKMLVRIEPPNEGYLELSPSFHTPRQTMTFTRPSSFHSSVYRSRSSSFAPGRRIIIGSLLPYVIV